MSVFARWIRGRAPVAAFLAGIWFLGFFGGSFLTLAKVYPAPFFRDAYRASAAVYRKYSDSRNPFNTNLWAPARSARKGVTAYDPDKAWGGLTLYTSGHSPEAFLIDMQGRTVYGWHRPFSSIWDDSAAVTAPVPDRQIYMRKSHVFSNGDLLAIYEGVGDSPYGYGMVKLDRDSQVIWKNLDRFHHDFTVAPDGLIYAFTHRHRSSPLEGMDHLDLPLLEDFLVILNPEGKEIRRISLLEAVNRSRFSRLLKSISYKSVADPTHANSLDVLDKESSIRLGAKVPVAAQGQVLLSFRELGGGSIALLDIDKEEIVWALNGPWNSQHDADILPNGNILMFDNRGNFGPGGESRVIEVDPSLNMINWQYAGDEKNHFESLIRSEQQRLPNGNTLITESDGGRLREVTAGGEVVWEFINPVRGGEAEDRIPIVCWGQRIDPEALDANFREELEKRSSTGKKKLVEAAIA